MIKNFRCTTIPALHIFNCVNTLNSKKIGRSRRGTLVLKKVEWTVEHYGTEKYYNLTLEWERPKYKAFYVKHNDNTMKLVPILNHTDHNKLLKVIKKSKRK